MDDPDAPLTNPEHDAVLAANRAFYEAFEAGDLDAMSDLWLHDDRAFCTHPGWRTLHGWGAIAGSWVALFGNGQRLQFIVTDERAVVAGDAGWVTCDENILGGSGSGTVAAVNLFVRHDGHWRMAGHLGTAVARQ
jgi:ketosteroid isomerase-like protein